MACRYCISKTSISFVILIVLLCIGANDVKAQAGRLPDSEEETLKEIAAQLGNSRWNFNVNPCNDPSWIRGTLDGPLKYNNSLNCNCSFPDGVCHVINIFLKVQDLVGTLPPALAKLPYLKAVDFNRNSLSGTIPREWASMKLESLSLSANNLSGPIDYLGNITTLKYLSIESNLFFGLVSPKLGNLVNLEKLILNANNFTGELSANLTNLTKLKELRISSNNFIGRVPDFFQSWKHLQILEMQATGFKGPIPFNISTLSNLTELRISDLVGDGSTFPPLQNMRSLKNLMLRNCNITGQIPPYISEMIVLTGLDLSFNRLEGKIPDFGGLTQLEAIYLTGNLLSGPIPEWIKSRDIRYQIDLSYNNFAKSSAPNTCPENINLFKSFPESDNSILTECLKNSPCSKDQYSLHINCGGNTTTVGNIKYEADLEPGGLAKFIHMNGDTWGFSSIGEFLDVSRNSKESMAENHSMLSMDDSSLYMNARLSPLSLTYYARCLANGNYAVKLHFAEIIFQGNKSFRSLGRRMFNVYIQNVLVLKNFDIKKEAQGVDKGIVRKFTTIVKNKTLEIRFYWAGRGTKDIPIRGTYGPLISAINIDSDSNPPGDGEKKIFLMVGMAVLALILVLIILGILRWKGYLGGKKSNEQELKGLDLQVGFFTYTQIKAATNNFDPTNKLGEGGFGSVYKGTLLDGTTIAVKQLSTKSKQGNREFVTEIGMISGLQHPNLVKLYGCCIDRKHMLLVYEYMENNSLAHALFGTKEGPVKLDWHTRQRICVGLAKGLAFLHDDSPLKIIHRDIKTSNVLLDRDFNPKIFDFGLAKLDEEDNTHISTRVAGTIGYMAPEYALWGYLTYKADVYSYGIVALEIVAGKNNMKYRPNEDFVCLLDWALVLQQKRNLMELVDLRLGSNFSKEEAIKIIKVAILCTNPSPALRPTMSAVLSMLEGKSIVPEMIMDSSIYSDESKFKALRDKFNQALGPSSTDS